MKKYYLYCHLNKTMTNHENIKQINSLNNTNKLFIFIIRLCLDVSVPIYSNIGTDNS